MRCASCGFENPVGFRFCGQCAAPLEIGEQLGERASLIAHHWEEAGRSYEAARRCRRAAFRVTNIVPRGRRHELR